MTSDSEPVQPDPEQVTLPENDPGEGRQVQPSLDTEPVEEPPEPGAGEDTGGPDTQLSPNRD